MVLKLQTYKTHALILALLALAMVFSNPAQAQLKQKKSKAATPPPPTETDKKAPKPEDNDSKPVLIKQDSSLITKENLPTKDTIVPLDNNDNTANPSQKTVKKNSKPGVITLSKKNGIAKPVRFEKQMNVTSQDLHVLTFARKVLVVYPSDEKPKKSKKKWILECYDENFKRLWQNEVAINSRWRFRDYQVIDRVAYVSFGLKSELDGDAGVTSRSGLFGSLQPYSYEVVSATPKGDIQTFMPRFSRKGTGDLSVDIIGKDNVYFAGKTQINPFAFCALYFCNFYCCLLPATLGINPKQRPILVQSGLNHFSGKSANKIPLVTKGFGEVRSLSYDPATKETNILVINAPEKHVVTESIKQFDQSGQNITSIELKGKDNLVIKDADILTSDSGCKYSFGNYTILDKRYYKKKNFDLDGNYFIPSFSSIMKQSMKQQYVSGDKAYMNLKDDKDHGYYLAKIVDGKQQNIVFTPYSKIKSFVDVFSKENLNRDKKASRSYTRTTALTPYKRNLTFIPHKLIEYNDQLIYVTEVTHQLYSYGSNNTIYYYGYIFDAAIVVAFDHDGNLLWDNKFEMNDLVSFNKKPHVNLFFDDNKIVMSYAAFGQIYSKSISGSEVIDEKSNTKIDVKANEVVKTNYEQDMQYWYDNYFVVFGLQKIKEGTGSASNKDNIKIKKSTRTFFMNKVAYQ